MRGLPKRTAAQQLAADAEHVVIGGEQFTLRPLVIARARKLRQAVVGKIREGLQAEAAADTGRLIDLVDGFFETELIDLAKLVLPELAARGDDWIEEHVTAAELQNVLATAFMLNFPWIKKVLELGQMGAMVTGILAETAQAPEMREGSTKGN